MRMRLTLCSSSSLDPYLLAALAASRGVGTNRAGVNRMLVKVSMVGGGGLGRLERIKG